MTAYQCFLAKVCFDPKDSKKKLEHFFFFYKSAVSYLEHEAVKLTGALDELREQIRLISNPHLNKVKTSLLITIS